MLYEVITFVLHLIIISCQSGTSKSETANNKEVTTVEETTVSTESSAVPAGNYTMKPDTIEIKGKFTSVITSYSIHYTKLYEKLFPKRMQLLLLKLKTGISKTIWI